MTPEETQKTERAVLAAVFNDPGRAMQVYRYLRPDDFTVATHGDIFAAVLALIHRGEVPTADLVAHHLEKVGSRTASPFAKFIAKQAPPESLESAVKILAEEKAFNEAVALRPDLTEIRTSGGTIEDYYQRVAAYAKRGLDAVHSLKPDAKRARPVGLKEFLSEPRKEQMWLVEDFIARESICMVSAEGGVGKTWLATQLSLAISAGKDTLGWRIKRPARTLIVEAEGARDPMRERVALAARTMGINPDSVRWAIQPAGSSRYHFDSPAFRDLVAASQAEFVVCDTLQHLRPAKADDNSAEDFMRYVVEPLKDLTNELGSAFFILDHQAKDKEKKGRGTSAKRDDSDLYLRMLQPDPDDQHRVLLYVDKNRYGKLGYGIPMRLLPHHGVFMLEGQKPNPIESGVKRAAELVAAGHKNGSAIAAQLIGELSLTKQQAQEALTEAEKAGAIVLVEQKGAAGVYGPPGTDVQDAGATPVQVD